jgi:hypothetical protein
MSVKKTSELEGPDLDAAVAYAMRIPHSRGLFVHGVERVTLPESPSLLHWAPSTDWAQGGPLIEREGIQLSYDAAPSIEGGNPLPWFACIGDEVAYMRDAGWNAKGEGYSSTPLVAAMRAFVQAKIGEEVDFVTPNVGVEPHSAAGKDLE